MNAHIKETCVESGDSAKEPQTAACCCHAPSGTRLRRFLPVKPLLEDATKPPATDPPLAQGKPAEKA